MLKLTSQAGAFTLSYLANTRDPCCGWLLKSAFSLSKFRARHGSNRYDRAIEVVLLLLRVRAARPVLSIAEMSLVFALSTSSEHVA
jgi:hypothetical protein